MRKEKKEVGRGKTERIGKIRIRKERNQKETKKGGKGVKGRDG